MRYYFFQIRLLAFGLTLAVLATAGCAAHKMPQDRKFQITVTGEHAFESRSPLMQQPEKAGDQTLVLDPEAVKSADQAAGDKDSDKSGKTKDENEDQGPHAISKTRDSDKKSVKKPIRQQSDEKKDLVLNFENADLADVVRHMTEVLGISYILETPINGKVTIHTAGKLSRSELWPVFYRILEINGLTAVQRGEYYHIVESKDLARLPVLSNIGLDVGEGEGTGGVVVQIIPLRNISAGEMTKLLTPFTTPEGKIVTEPASNTLIVVDYRDSIDKILSMVEAFDTDIFEKINYQFFTLDHVDVEEMVELLEKIYSSYFQRKDAGSFFLPIRRINTVLVISSTKEIFDSVGDFIDRLDTPREGMAPQIYVYSVQNGQAGEIADLLNEVFRSEKKKESDAFTQDTGISTNPFARDSNRVSRDGVGGNDGQSEKSQNVQNGENSESQKSAAEIAQSNTLRDHVKIVADESRNSLIIEAIPPDYRLIAELLKKVDVMPRQVLIKMTIAEVTLDESSELGMEWSYVKGEGGGDSGLLSASAGAAGFKYTIGEVDRWSSALSAMASKNKVNILSSPTILASNSRNAKIDISREVPVSSSQYEYTSGENPVVTTNIEYRDTGVMLSVTPHINEAGLVTMDIEQEVSEQADSVLVGNQTYPSFFKRRAETTLSVKSGQAIVIGGLIKETQSAGSTGAPWFVTLPVLKFIFGKETGSVSKTELIIFISPQVIASLEDVDVITDDFRQQMEGIINSAQ